MDDYDYADDLRGEGSMNAKESSIIPAIIVGVILTAANVFIARSASHGDSTIAAIAELRTTVAQLNKQVEKLTEQPYVRRDEFHSGITTASDRISGLEKRVDGLAGRVERVEIQR